MLLDIFNSFLRIIFENFVIFVGWVGGFGMSGATLGAGI